MSAGPATPPQEAARFRRRLLLALMTVVAGLTVGALYAARRSIAADEEHSLEREFQATLTSRHDARELRHAALVERSRALARKARIIAALEDDALDLLYLSARDELRDATLSPAAPAPAEDAPTMRSRFYRFLDAHGRVLAPPPDDDACGTLAPAEQNQLALPRLMDRPQTGYVVHETDRRGISEIMATPIISSETGAAIAALVQGFDVAHLATPAEAARSVAGGVWLDSHLHLPAASPAARATLADLLRREVSAASNSATGITPRFPVDVDGTPQVLFFQQLNPGSPYPPAFEVALFPLKRMQARQRRATWQIAAVGSVLMGVGFVTSHQLAARFSEPVARLARDSTEQRQQRQQAEAALEVTTAELERAARFSADASHQLKTPVTVLRAGLEEMIARGGVPPSEIEEVSALIHQTFRLSTLIEDLLLLSRLDAGQLKIKFTPVDLASLIEASLDDLSASPDGLELEVSSDFEPPLFVAGERGYISLILQNLLENARKYNRPGGRIHLAARREANTVMLAIGNTARRPIPLSAQPLIFERFHRAAMGEDVPGYGIGLNLARELARLHDGDLRLVRSDDDWTEFEVRFRPAETRNPFA